jgi:N-acetylmuramoyl-L-alanine amidase
MEPGEGFVRAVLERAGGTFTPEEGWKNRTGEGWSLVREPPPDRRPRALFDKGRGLTTSPKAGLRSIVRTFEGFVQEDMRLKYLDRGKIAPTGVVLHFTRTPDYAAAQRVLQERALWPTLMADRDAVHQVLDAIEDTPAAAAGTNDACIQIEIVGMDERELLSNDGQTKAVLRAVAEICEKYGIPKTNEDIASLRGVFSHGQAKKRFGRSVDLFGEDFDPGENYMRRIIEGAGGVYVPEDRWKDRRSDDWVILPEPWLP